MSWLTLIPVDKFILFSLVLTRVSGLTMTAPIYGGKDVPMQVRALLALALAILITPTQWDVPIAHPGTMPMYLVYVATELLMGVCLGLGIVVLLSGVQVAGEMIGYTSGLMLADAVDPGTDTNVPLFSRLMSLVALAAFVCIGGHRLVMAGLLDTFASIPPGSGAVPISLAEAFVTLVAQSFHLAIRTALPAVTALLLATLVMGLIARTLPQLNIMAVGFSLTAMLAIGALALTLGAAVAAFRDQIAPAIELLLDALKSPLQSDWLRSP